MTGRNESWQIATDLERAARTVREAAVGFSKVHHHVADEIYAISGSDDWADQSFVLADALQALSDRYQAIADAEPS